MGDFWKNADRVWTETIAWANGTNAASECENTKESTIKHFEHDSDSDLGTPSKTRVNRPSKLLDDFLELCGEVVRGFICLICVIAIFIAMAIGFGEKIAICLSVIIVSTLVLVSMQRRHWKRL
jgi:hypothetical protein